MFEVVTGFCPTQNCEYSITVEYTQISGNRYVQTSCDCEYLSYDFSRCPIYKECPLRAKAPKEKSCV